VKLRPRIALTTAALLVPVAILFVLVEGRLRDREASDLLAERATAMLDEASRAQCEASPDAWVRAVQGSPGLGAPPPPRGGRSGGAPPVHLYPFDAELRPSVPWTPPLGSRAIEAARSGGGLVRDPLGGPDDPNEAVLLRTSWATGPCAWVLAVRPGAPSTPPEMLLRAWAAPLLALVGAVVLALGPTVARIRRLGAKVRASAEHRYSELVEMPGNDEIADLAAAFDGAAREVRSHLDAQEQREQTLRDFLANTAHDVMTPLTVLQGHLANLRAAATAGTAVDAATLDAALDEATYMGALLNNLAVAARLEAGEPHLVRVPVDVARVVERCVSRHGPMARQRGVAMEHAVPETAALIQGDVTFLEQAIGNVVYNAVRHNREGGHVAVVLSPRGGGFRVRVADDGPGMSDEDLARLNGAGATDAARTRHADGHGLGLSITRRVAALHGMSLVFARSEAGGVEVDFEWSVP
jgi:signal transduction histidine kinase